jgi:WD40 repeat protein/DNA-binding SARP family transcriptional activator
MDATLEIFTLGGVRILRGGEPVPALTIRKAEALLVYLASTRREQSREVLADFFWDERTQSQSLGYLRVALSALHKHLGESLLIGRETVALNPAMPLWLDTAQLEDCLRVVHQQGRVTAETADQVADALELYRGDFLEGFRVSECRRFEEWALRERERLHRLAVDGLYELVAYEIESGAYQPGMGHAARLLELDPLMEAAQRQMMRLLAYCGQRSAALGQYETCRRLLREELGLEPEAETVALYEQIRAGQLVVGGEPGLPPEGAHQPRAVGECPYRGLSAFQEADAPFYFGRESFVDDLERAVRSKRLVTVIVGSSGSGKSSALFAGLLPRLREEGGYRFAIFRPARQPFYALAGALLPLLQGGLSETEYLAETRKLAECLLKGQVGLEQVIERILDKDTSMVLDASIRQVLLVVDQFEELYTLCADGKTQNAFIDELLSVVAASQGRRSAPCSILITLRADFMGQALAYRPFADALQEGSLMMGPMTRQELRRAIEQPAGMQGAAFEAGLVERILDDVGEKPGVLPLLEFTLTQLWERQNDGWLVHADYEAMGCVEGALSAYAEQVYGELYADEREPARRALVQLVQPGDGTEDTRRVAAREELGEGSWPIIQHLADKRLVVTGRDAQGRETVEVAHEALIQKWSRFQEWMDADRAFRLWQERLRGGLRQWQESGRDEGALLRGAPLAVAQGWLSERGEELSQSEVEYIQQSQALQERRQRERQRQRQRVVLGLAAGLVVALALAVFAFIQRQEARMQAGILLASQAESEITLCNTDRAVLLALEALEDYPYTPQAEHALGQAVTYNRSLALYEGHTAAVTGAAWSSNGGRIATSSFDNSMHIWEADTGKLVRRIDLPKGITGNIYDMALTVQWSPDDRYLLTLSGDRFFLGSQDFDLLLWDVESGQQVAAREVQNSTPPSTGELGTAGAVHFTTGAGAAFAKDGRLATLGGDNTALVWEPLLAGQPLALSRHTAGVNAVNWSPDYTRLATASEDGTARVWDAANGQELLQLAGHSGAVNQVAWSPDGILIATGGDDGTLWLWDAVSGEGQTSFQPVPSTGSGATSERIVNSLAWSPDGGYIASGSGDGYIRLWQVGSAENTLILKAHEQHITFLAWSPQGERLVSAGMDGRARVWSVAPDNMMLSLPYGWAWAEWAPDGEHFAVGTLPGFLETTPDVKMANPGLVAVWDFKAGKPLFETHADKDENWGWASVHYSPDGRYLLSRTMLEWPDITDANKIYIFDSQNGEIVRKLETGKETLLLMGGWSPDGQMVAAGDYEGTVYFWEASSGELLRTLNCLSWGHIVQWSPDGSKIAMLCIDWDDNLMAIQVVDAETYETVLYFDVNLLVEQYQFVRWSPDSTRLVIGGGSDEMGLATNPIYIYDASSGEELLKIFGHTSQLMLVSWSPDGKRIASGSTDDTTRIWDAQTGAELLTLPTPGDWYVIPDWSPDGKYLLVTVQNLFNPGQNGVWRVWQSTQELVDYAKECCVFRELTEAEREQFGLR